MSNNADLFHPITSMHIGPAPLVIRTIVKLNQDYIAGGMPSAAVFAEDYVLLSSLPRELQERVITAVKAIQDGM